VKMRTAARRMMTIVDVSHLVTPRQIQKKCCRERISTPHRDDRTVLLALAKDARVENNAKYANRAPWRRRKRHPRHR
jgi:hypothetical protein